MLKEKVEVVHQYLNRSIRLDRSDFNRQAVENWITRVNRKAEDFEFSVSEPRHAIDFIKGAFSQHLAQFKFNDLRHIQNQIEKIIKKLENKVQFASDDLSNIKEEIEKIIEEGFTENTDDLPPIDDLEINFVELENYYKDYQNRWSGIGRKLFSLLRGYLFLQRRLQPKRINMHTNCLKLCWKNLAKRRRPDIAGSSMKIIFRLSGVNRK